MTTWTPKGGAQRVMSSTTTNAVTAFIDVMEEPVEFTLPTQRSSALLGDRCSARDDSTEQLGGHMNMQAI